MDSRIVNELAEKFRERTVRMTPALIHQLGLVKKNTSLKIDEFLLSCVPFDLSLGGASLIGFLSPKEIAFFETMRGRPQKLSLSFITPYAKKPVNFFVVCAIKAFRKPDPDSPYCFIDVAFRDAPPDLKEILVTYFADTDDAERIFKETPDTGFTREQILSIMGDPHVSLLKQGCEAPRLRVINLSPRGMRLFGEFVGNAPVPGEEIDLEASDQSRCVLHGTVQEIIPFPEAPEFATIGLTLQFNSCLVSRIKKLLPPLPKA